MKKALPILLVLGIGAIALYVVVDFKTSRLTAARIQEIQDAEERLAQAETKGTSPADATAPANGEPSAEPAPDAGDSQPKTEDVPAVAPKPAKILPPAIVAVAPESMPATAPDTFTVALECTNGIFAVECRKDWAPNGVERFYELVKDGYFTDMRVFRVVKGPNLSVAQFGISGDPQKSAKWLESNIQDDPVRESNVTGTVTFAAAGQPNTRSAQLFVNLADNTFLDDRGFAPIGKVVFGMDTAQGLYSGYGEQLTQLQGQIAAMGNSFLDSQFPKLDSIKRAFFVEKIEEVKAPEPIVATPKEPTRHPMETAPSVYKVRLETTKGFMIVECHREWAPLGADRFFTLVKQGFYNGSPFFRVITEPKPYIAQFGINVDSYANEDWAKDTLDLDPVKESNTVGRVSFAMKPGRPETRSFQVFINLADNSRLDGLGIAPFGEIVEGMDVVRNLYSGYQDKADQAGMIETGETFWLAGYPLMDIIKKATIVE